MGESRVRLRLAPAAVVVAVAIGLPTAATASAGRPDVRPVLSRAAPPGTGLAGARSCMRAVGTIGLRGQEPYGAAVDPRTDRIYVTNESGQVSVINGLGDRVTGSVSTAVLAAEVAVNPRTDRVYVTEDTFNSPLWVISGHTNQVIATVPVGNESYGVAVDPVTSRVYVVSRGSNTMTVIDGQTDKVITTVPSGDYPFGVAVNPVTGRIYVADHFDNAIAVFSAHTSKIIAWVHGISGPFSVAVDRRTNRVYVTTDRVNPHVAQGVAVINGATNRVIARLAIAPGNGGNPGIAADPLTDVIYTVAVNGTTNTVVAINGRTSKIIAAVPVGSEAAGVTVDSFTNRVYVANIGSGTVSVLTGCPGTPHR